MARSLLTPVSVTTRRGFVAVSLVAFAGFFWAILKDSPIVPWREYAGDRIERLGENPDKLQFFSAEAAQTGDAPSLVPIYRWTGKEIDGTWRKKVDRENVTLTSPRLDFKSPEEIESILIKIAAPKDVTEFTLFWSDEPALSSTTIIQNRKELRSRAGESSTTFVVPGEDIYDLQFLGTEAAEKPLHHVFLRFPASGDHSIALDYIQIATKTERLATRPYGQVRLGLRGEIRDVLYVRTPGTVVYTADLPAGARLLFGAHGVDPSARVRYTVTVKADRLITAFDRVIDEEGGWRDFSVPLPRATNAVITLGAESDRPGNVAVWSSPMILTPPRNFDRPNVILYVMDALRADRLGCYGYTKETSPFLDRLAEKGVLFRRSYAAAAWTKPSVVSLMTSLYPETHRLGARSYTDVLPDSVVTLSDYMRQNGYVSAQFSANPLASTLSNLDQGFDYAFTPNSFHVSGAEAKQNKIHSDDLNAKVLPWLEAHSRERFFINVHSVDTHPPFLRREVPPHLVGSGSESDLYDAAISYNDRELARLYAKLEELGLAANTLLIVTADHGEAFSEHGQVGHGRSVYEEEIRVPLIMVHPGRLRPRVVEEPVDLVSVMPTVLDYCSIDRGATQLQGTNLLAPPDRSGGDRQLFVSRFVFELDASMKDFAGKMIYAVIEDRFKLVVSEEDGRAEPRLELYDLAADPRECCDVSQKESQRVERLYSALGKFLSRQKEARLAFKLEHDGPGHGTQFPWQGGGQAIPEDARGQLKTLGYVK